MSKMKYKQGDKVIIKNSYNCSINNIGSIVKIDESKNTNSQEKGE